MWLRLIYVISGQEYSPISHFFSLSYKSLVCKPLMVTKYEFVSFVSVFMQFLLWVWKGLSQHIPSPHSTKTLEHATAGRYVERQTSSPSNHCIWSKGHPIISTCQTLMLGRVYYSPATPTDDGLFWFYFQTFRFIGSIRIGNMSKSASQHFLPYHLYTVE